MSKKTGKHTPGPWKAARALETSPGQFEIQVRSYADGSTNGLYVGSVWATNAVEGKANAALIAAAPELLRALKFTRNVIDNACGQPDGSEAKRIYDLVVKAIARAEVKS